MKSNKSLEDKYLDFLNDLLTKIDLSIMLEDNTYVSSLKENIKQLIKETYYQSKINKLKENEINKVKIYLLLIDKNELYIKNNLVLHTALNKNNDIEETIYNLLFSLKIYAKPLNNFKKGIDLKFLEIINRASSLNLYYYIKDSKLKFNLSTLSKMNLDKVISKNLEITQKEFDKLNFKELFNI